MAVSRLLSILESSRRDLQNMQCYWNIGSPHESCLRGPPTTCRRYETSVPSGNLCTK
ncbi:unnamed protein product, partial [Musa textilis]